MVQYKPIAFKGESLLGEISPEVSAAAGMLSQAERKLLCGIANRYEGNGKIIDGGSFFGSSTVSLASGLSDAKPGVIHAYEIGFLPNRTGRTITRQFGDHTYLMGESFVSLLKDTIEPWNSLITLHIGDLLKEKWPGDPIEICFIDVCKTPALNAHVTTQFFPNILKGGYLINQDYFFDRLPYVKATMGYLEEHFEWIGRVYTSSVWKCIKPVPQYVADYDPYLNRHPRCLEWHDMAVNEHLDDEALFRLAISRSYLANYLGEDSVPTLDGIERDFAEYISANGKIWDKKNIRRRDAQFRIDRARKELTDQNVLNQA